MYLKVKLRDLVLFASLLFSLANRGIFLIDGSRCCSLKRATRKQMQINNKRKAGIIIILIPKQSNRLSCNIHVFTSYIGWSKHNSGNSVNFKRKENMGTHTYIQKIQKQIPVYIMILIHQHFSFSIG